MYVSIEGIASKSITSALMRYLTQGILSGPTARACIREIDGKKCHTYVPVSQKRRMRFFYSKGGENGTEIVRSGKVPSRPNDSNQRC